MTLISSVFICVTALAILYAPLATALESKEIDVVNVLADKSLSVALSEIASLYTQEKSTTVTNSFGNSDKQEKRIEDGEPVDFFITDNAAAIQQLKYKDLIDLHSIGHLVSLKEHHFVGMVIAGDNLASARDYSTFLKSEDAKRIFVKNGLTIP